MSGRAKLLALLLVLPLSGCGLLADYEKDAAIRVDGEELQVSVCGAVTVGELHLDRRNLEVSGEWEEIWALGGELIVESGQVLDSELVEAAGGSVDQDAAVRPGDSVRLLVAAPGPEGGGPVIVDHTYLVGDGGLTGAWLLSGGTMSEESC